MTGHGNVKALKETRTAKALLEEWVTVDKVIDIEESIADIDDMIENILKYLVSKESENQSSTTMKVTDGAAEAMLEDGIIPKLPKEEKG